MKRSSIFITITIIFLLALTSIFIAFLWLIDYDKQNYARELNAKYSNVAQANLFYMSGLISESEYNLNLKNIDMPEVTNKTLRDKILNNATIIEEISDDLGSIAILLYEKNHYLKIVHLDDIKILKDKEFQAYRYEIIKFVFGVVAFILLMAYAFVIYKLKPLRKLKRQIKKFADGNLSDIQNVSSGNDEISEISEAFYDAVLQIKALNDSRNLFLRNIMHELKTPITKGRLVAEMMQSSKSKERFISVFNKLESLINELAAIEQITSKITPVSKTICFIDDIIDEARDIAMIDDNQIVLNIKENFKLNVEFRYFCIAVKNMIDNAIKYSNDKKVILNVCDDKIEFISSGKELEYSIDYYIEPFAKGQNAKKSFGLGLYIVSNILSMHDLKLDYSYKNGYNIFIFENLKYIIKR